MKQQTDQQQSNALTIVEADASFRKKDLDKYLNSCQPVVIRGLNKQTRAIKHWNAEYFLNMIKRNSDVISPRRVTPVGTDNISFKEITMTPQPISEIVADCINTDDPDREIYIPGMRISSMPYLEQDAPKSSLLKDIGPDLGEIFMGRNTQCVCHYHPDSQALLCQMQGRKHVRLYSPSQFKKLKPFSIFSKNYNRCKINFYQKNRKDFPNVNGIDSQRYPDVVNTQCIDLVLEPGDALFIPIHWGHITQGKGWNVSIAYFWKAQLREWGLNY